MVSFIVVKAKAKEKRESEWEREGEKEESIERKIVLFQNSKSK